MLKKNRAGRLTSLVFIAEEMGNPQPLYGLVGRYRAEPARAIGQLVVMTKKLTELAADGAPDLVA